MWICATPKQVGVGARAPYCPVHPKMAGGGARPQVFAPPANVGRRVAPPSVRAPRKRRAARRAPKCSRRPPMSGGASRPQVFVPPAKVAFAPPTKVGRRDAPPQCLRHLQNPLVAPPIVCPARKSRAGASRPKRLCHLQKWGGVIVRAACKVRWGVAPPGLSASVGWRAATQKAPRSRNRALRHVSAG